VYQRQRQLENWSANDEYMKVERKRTALENILVVSGLGILGFLLFVSTNAAVQQDFKTERI
jgi:hypothetical protein